MSLAELLPEIETLSREDKRLLMETLQQDLKEQELLARFPDGEYPIWSPYESYEAAVKMLEVLRTGKDTEE
jgi:PleD family two-component response regulator